MIDDELLIECVRQYEELYNPNHKLYNDSVHKENVWKNIGAQLNKSAQNCKTRWVYARDQYRKFLNKKKVHGNKKKYRYEENLEFLLPFFRERDKRRAEKSINDGQFEFVLDDISLSQMENADQTEEKYEEKVKKRKRTIEPSSSVSPNIELIRIKSEECLDENSTSLEIVDSSEFDVRKKDSTNHIDSFFAAMAATVKTFSVYNQIIAKSKIFSVISELEMKQIKQEVGEPLNE